MLLKYKEQAETRRNINQTHNPKVVGSNPTPATNLFNWLHGFLSAPQTPNNRDRLRAADGFLHFARP
jgi:hypothetical protein